MSGEHGGSTPVEVQNIGEWTVVRFATDRLTDYATIGRISDRLHADLNNLPMGAKVLINFRGVQHASSQVVGLILSLKTLVEKTKGTFCLCRLERPMREVLRLTKLDKVLDVRDSERKTVGVEHYHNTEDDEDSVRWMG